MGITDSVWFYGDFSNYHIDSSYNKDAAIATIGATGPLGSAGTISAI